MGEVSGLLLEIELGGYWEEVQLTRTVRGEELG